MAALVRCGWGVISPAGFRLTRDGLRFADAAAEKFLRVEPAAAPTAAEPVLSVTRW
jgi:hypothetical protein